MFEKYTEKARRVIFFARYEASQFGSPYIETEHLLLGLLREDKALTNRFLGSHAAVESIRKQIEGRTTIRERVSTSVDLPLSEQCKRVLTYAAEEAERLSHKHIGTEHLLLGLLREEKCFAAQILQECGLTLAAARETIASGEFLDQSAKPELAEARSRVIQDPFQRMLEHAEYLEFIDISNGLRVGLCRFLMRPTVPRIGEEVILGSRSFRVRDVVYAFQDLPPQTGAGDKRLTQIVVKVEPSGEPSGRSTAAETT
jgi:hypothetical protein